MSLSFIFLPTVELLSIVATGIVLLFGGLSVAQGNLTLGTVIAFLAYVNRFFLPVQELSQLYATMQTAMAGGERVINLLNTEPEIKDRPDADRHAADKGPHRIQAMCNSAIARTCPSCAISIWISQLAR